MAGRERQKLSRQQRRDLDIEIGFLAGLVRRDPEYVEALRVLGDDLSRRGSFDESLRVDERLACLRPADPLAHYNLACSYVLTGQHEAAFDALNRALDCGFRDFRWLARDPDLAPFRKHPLYRRLRARVRTLQVKVD